jgi:two-component system sensor kinase FixL
MNWVTIAWSSVSGACLMLALTHLVIWCRVRHSWSNLWFFITVISVMGMMALELIAMQTQSPRVFETVVCWAHPIYLLTSLGLLGFVHCYFGTGRRWLFALALGLRLSAVAANFATGSSLHFIVVHSLKRISFFGEQVAVPAVWEPNPWIGVGLLASFILLIYVADAAWTLWRSQMPDSRRRAGLLGGSLAFFVLLAPGLPALVSAGLLDLPLIASFPFLGMVLAMGYELSREVLRAARLSIELRASRERLALAAAAANLALWEWEIATGHIWVSDEGRALYGVPSEGDIDLGIFLATLHPDDRVAVSRKMEEAIVGSSPYAAEYRVVLPDGSIHWLSAIGRVEMGTNGRAILMRGVSMDFTSRKKAEHQTEIQRQELAHLSRVSVLGEMSGALAHELNQPLSAILSNSQVGRRSLESDQPDLAEMAAILDDVASDAKRAGGIIHGMRAMLKRDSPSEPEWLVLDELVHEVMAMLNSQIASRRVKVKLDLDGSLSKAWAGRVEIQQVLVNLVINGLDAIGVESRNGILTIGTSQRNGSVLLSVKDSGPGISAAIMPRLFDPFFSTKSGGLGLGLSISRSIMERNGGELKAQNHREGGAVFYMILPIGIS